MNRTLLLLGGSAQQVIAIERARELGYRTVLCDYLPDNPGRLVADVFYQVSTTNQEAVLEVARKEAVDGVVAYSSDPAAPTAAYVAQELGLPGVPLDTAVAFCEKHLFRGFLREHGFNVPASVSVKLGGSLPSEVFSLRLPLIVKPTDSSGSKGVTVVRDFSCLEGALEAAELFSRNGVVIVEEFVERDHPHVIEAEVFAVGGEVASWGLINSIRDTDSNPLLPAGYSYPLDLSDTRSKLVRREVSRLVAASGVSYGAFNIEMIIDCDDRLFFLDAGPRNGGNMLPEFISLASGKDLVAATVSAAMGDYGSVDVSFDGCSGGFWGLGVLHSNRPGRFARMNYSPEAIAALVSERLQVSPGDDVLRFERCNDLVGLSFFRFESKRDMDDVMLDMGTSMHVVLEEG